MFALPVIIAVILFAPATLTGVLAKSFGFNFKKWFWLGFFFPFISTILLFFLLPAEVNTSKAAITKKKQEKD
jgi:predicted membrane protein